MVGEQVGDYIIEGVLGSGSFAEVCRGRHIDLAHQRALKILRRTEPHLRERFRHEARILAHLRHPCFPRFIELHTTPADELVIITELVEGPPAHTWMDTYVPSMASRLAVFEQVLRGVVHLHEQGIVHRDLKPNNILIEADHPSPRAFIVDFGIAQDTSRRLTSQGQIMGTPGFTAPEQLMDASACTDRADVYALGTFLYGLLRGFPDRDPDDALELSGLPDDLARHITEMTAPDPERRPSAAEILGRWSLTRGTVVPSLGPTLVAPESLAATYLPASAAPMPTPMPAPMSASATTVPDARPPARGVRPWHLGGTAFAAALMAAGLTWGAASASHAPTPVAVAPSTPAPRQVEVACVLPDTAPAAAPVVVERTIVESAPAPAVADATPIAEPEPDDRRRLWPFGRKNR